MPKYLNQIKALKRINKSIVTNNKFLINKEGNIKIYYAPFHELEYLKIPSYFYI